MTVVYLFGGGILVRSRLYRGPPPAITLWEQESTNKTNETKIIDTPDNQMQTVFIKFKCSSTNNTIYTRSTNTKILFDN